MPLRIQKARSWISLASPHAFLDSIQIQPCSCATSGGRMTTANHDGSYQVQIQIHWHLRQDQGGARGSGVF